jgi:SAM-dependent methyltransferase
MQEARCPDCGLFRSFGRTGVLVRLALPRGSAKIPPAFPSTQRGTLVERSEFDAFADEYERLHSQNIRLSGEEPAYFAQQKAQMAAALVADALPRRRILDFGTGVGNSIGPLQQHFPRVQIEGIDVSQRSLEIAASRFPDLATFRHFDGATIPSADGSFGLAFAACVFHHIDAGEHEALIRELRRVLAPGGWLTIFEHNPFNPLTRRAVNTCEFDRNARLLTARTLKAVVRRAGFTRVQAKYCVFFPKALKALRPLENRLGWLPLGAQYCVVARV